MSVVVCWPNNCPQSKIEQSLNFPWLVCAHALFLWSPPLGLLTTGWERKQGIQRCALADANSWRLHRLWEWIKLLHIRKSDLMFGQKPFVCTSGFSWLFYFNTIVQITQSAHLDKLMLLGIHLIDHLIFNCIELLASFKSCKEVYFRECALIIADISIGGFAHKDTLV